MRLRGFFSSFFFGGGGGGGGGEAGIKSGQLCFGVAFVFVMILVRLDVSSRAVSTLGGSDLIRRSGLIWSEPSVVPHACVNPERRWVDNNSLKIISHTPVPVIKVTTVGYPPSCAPSTAFAAATAVAAASASGTATASAASAATAIGVGGGIGRTRSPCSPPVGWRGETSVEPGSAASSLPGGPQPTQPPAALEPPPIRAPGDRESAAATAAVAAAVAGVGMGVEDGSGRKGGEGAAPAMAPTANSGSTAVVETPSRDEGGSTTAAAAEAAAATDRDERDRGGVSEKEKRSVSSRPERPVTVKAYSSPLPGPPGESTGGGNERVAQGTKKKAPAKKSPATSSGGAAGGQDHNHHQDHSHDRAHRHDRGVDRASSAGAWAVASGGGGGVGVGVGAGGGGAGGVDPVGLPRVLVDVSFEGQGHNGQAANQLVKDLVDGFPALRPLALLLKQVIFLLPPRSGVRLWLCTAALLSLVVLPNDCVSMGGWVGFPCRGLLFSFFSGVFVLVPPPPTPPRGFHFFSLLFITRKLDENRRLDEGAHRLITSYVRTDRRRSFSPSVSYSSYS